MTNADIERVEAELSLRLPEAYRRLLTKFPIRFARGNATGPVWDDADELIRRNFELRSERRRMGHLLHALPREFLFIGDSGGGWQHLLDLRSEPPIVHVMEHEDVATIGPALDDARVPLVLIRWYDEYLTDLKKDGIDLDSETNPEESTHWGCVAFAIGSAVVSAFAIFGIWSLIRR